MNSSKIKILVAGDVNGRFKSFFQRVESINKKTGPFEILLCVGEFFSSDNKNDELTPYKNGSLNIPVPTYILGPNVNETAKFYENIKDGEICNNLTYLGKRGVFTLSSGLKIAYLSGLEANDNTPKSGERLYFRKEDVAAIRNLCFTSKNSSSDYRGIDVLLTSQWPYGVSSDTENASKLISKLCREIKPRYHFSGLNGKYYEPSPFRIPPDHTTQLELCTRFISLAHVGNISKSKYIYALSATPVAKMRILDLIQKSTNEIECPLLGPQIDDLTEGRSQYFFDTHSSDDNSGKRKYNDKHQAKRPRIMNIDQEKCWFCLSSPDVEKHLVLYVGNHFYLALAKGPINDFHILILSITHIASSSMLDSDSWEELLKFKQALRKFFKHNQQTVCFTERQYKSSHLQVNALGIDEGYAWKVEHAFEDKAEEYDLQFETLPPLTSPKMLPEKGAYFVVELPNEKTLLTRQMQRFPLHFARDVFCSENLLNCSEKVNWRDCSLTKDEEINMVQNIKQNLTKFDFTNLI